jgi:hypothetical protein
MLKGGWSSNQQILPVHGVPLLYLAGCELGSAMVLQAGWSIAFALRA